MIGYLGAHFWALWSVPKRDDSTESGTCFIDGAVSDAVREKRCPIASSCMATKNQCITVVYALPKDRLTALKHTAIAFKKGTP
jgi:hypothetical protein